MRTTKLVTISIFLVFVMGCSFTKATKGGKVIKSEPLQVDTTEHTSNSLNVYCDKCGSADIEITISHSFAFSVPPSSYILKYRTKLLDDKHDGEDNA